MEILVLSDSHGKTSKFEKILDRHSKIDFVIHLGDYSYDTELIPYLRPGVRIEAVHGNCDTKRADPAEKLLEIEEKRIFITHGHNYGVKSSLVSLVAKGIRENADVILYGHTHIPKVEMREGIWVVNPGSVSFPKEMNRSSYAIIEVSTEAFNARILEI